MLTLISFIFMVGSASFLRCHIVGIDRSTWRLFHPSSLHGLMSPMRLFPELVLVLVQVL